MSIYTDNGYQNREEYLEELSNQYGKELVCMFTKFISPEEDFSDLIDALDNAVSDVTL